MNSSIRVSDNRKCLFGLQRLMSDEQTGMQIYLLAFAIFLCEEALGTTMFQIPGRVYVFLKALALLIVFAKIMLFDTYESGSFWVMVCVLALGAVVFVSSGYTEAFLWICMVVGAKNVPFRKILQIYLIISVSIVLLAFSASLLGVIQNLQYDREDSVGAVRNSFGIIFTTDFASHIFSIVLVSFYLLKDRLRVYHYLICLALAGLIYYFCYTRLDSGCIVLLICLFAIVNTWRRRRTLTSRYRADSKKNSLWIWFMPIFAGLMFLATYVYDRNNRVLYILNEVLSDRLRLGNRALTSYGLTLFGRQINMFGHGGLNIDLKNYFFVDCSYLYVMLRYGILFLLVVLAIYVLCCRKYQNDPYFLAAIFVVAINCMIAHHLIELAYSPFALALLASMPKTTARGRPSMWEQN